MPEEKSNENIKIATEFKRANDFTTRYANNVIFETSVFDIKIVFGELSQPFGGTAFVEQHNAVTISWLEAKIAALFLSMNVAMHALEELKLPLMKLMELVPARPPVEVESRVSETKQ